MIISALSHPFEAGFVISTCCLILCCTFEQFNSLYWEFLICLLGQPYQIASFDFIFHFRHLLFCFYSITSILMYTSDCMYFIMLFFVAYVPFNNCLIDALWQCALDWSCAQHSHFTFLSPHCLSCSFCVISSLIPQ